LDLDLDFLDADALAVAAVDAMEMVEALVSSSTDVVDHSSDAGLQVLDVGFSSTLGLALAALGCFGSKWLKNSRRVLNP
jgi:hypothetical protein